MAWIEKIIPEPIKKRCYVYLVQRYFGQYLEEKLDPSQLSVDLYNGTCTLKNLLLDVQALNELAEQQNWPLEFVDGSVGEINISVPWSSLLKESSTIDVSSLKVTLQPKQRKESATSMFESMWTSMTSSMQLAEDCVKQTFGKVAKDEETPYEGLELFAQAIDSILSRVKVTFSNTTIQLEHLPKSSLTGVGIIVNIDLLTYSDESCNDPAKGEATEFTKADENKAYLEQSYTARTTRLEGITLSTVEFSSRARTVSQSIQSESCDREDFLTLVQETEDSLPEDETDSERNVVLFGKFSDKIEIVGRLKRTEDLDGPKVSIEMNGGALLLFLSPRQVHLLLELADGLGSPHNEDDSNVFRYRGKPMSHSDYERIERDLQQQVATPAAHFNFNELVGRHGWATGALDIESDIDDNYIPIRSHNDDAISLASTLDSSLTSSMITSTETSRTRKGILNKIEADPTAEISRMELHLASVSVVILHEDILTESLNSKGSLVSASVKQMQSLAQDFFLRSTDIFQQKEFNSINEILDRACQSNQLRILASQIHLEGDEKTTSSAYSNNAYLEASKLEINECLYRNNVERVQILNFENATAKPSLKLVMKRIAKTGNRVSSKSMPRKDLHVSLNKCTFELDITIIDRISALLNPQPICQIIKPSNLWGSPQSAAQDFKTDIRINSPSMKLILRFPKPDFRRDMNRMPWWQRNVRPDYLSMVLGNFAFQTTKQTNQSVDDFSVLCRTINVDYHEDVNGTVTHIAKAGYEDKFGTSMQDILQDCRLNIKIFNSKSPTLDLSMAQDPMTTSIAGILENQIPNNGPFSSKRVIYESDTPHYKHQQDDSKELLMPGDKTEINDFIKTTTDSAKIQIEIVLPVVSMQLISKHLYEIIYNRINNDLLLWEPSAPKPKSSSFNDNIGPFSNLDNDTNEIFTPCKNVVQYGSDGESDEDSDENSKIFYSAYGPRAKVFKQSKPQKKEESFLIINLQIKKGLLCLFVPVRDITTNNVIPGQNGEFLINVDDATVFMVNGYMGDKDLGFVCLEVHNANLHHCDMLSTPSQDPPIRDITSSPGHHLHSTITSSESGMLHNKKTKDNAREMITLCVRIKARHETHHVKNVAIALGFNRVTLRHRMCTEPNSWFSQLLDFFNVHDYPIPGYIAKEILTELYVHFWDSAIDYRPLYLPLRAAITIGSFSISSHLSAEVNSSTLRFIAEECGLFLSQKGVSKHKNYTGAADLKRDYVNVIDLGLFEISLKTCDKKNTDCPHFDLRASNNVINIRTCADSARALTQLIKYFASDGDLLQEEAGSAFSSPRHQSQQLVSVEPQEVTNLSESQHQQIHDLIQDALEDVEETKAKPSSDLYSYNGAKLFYFPGENNPNIPPAQVTTELGEVAQIPSDAEDDFCFIDKEPGFNIFPKNGVPEIRWLTQDTIRLVDNHFTIPSEKSDPLKTPKNYPTPIVKYTLCEMSIIWQMYGGNDFEPLDTRKTVNFEDSAVSFQNKPKEIRIEAKKQPKCHWVVRGGPNRDHSVLMELQLNKIRFQHEVYPECESKASRQVLIISEFEIRDRLKCSQMNKFLYHYTSQLRPKQSNANMIFIKTLHVRPDPKLRSQECCLKVSILPLRFNIDQDALQFLINFFGDLGGENKEEDDASISSKHSTPSHQPPVMTVAEDERQEQAKKLVDDNLMMFLDDNKSESRSHDEVTASGSTSEDSPIYFRKVIFSPDVPIRLDYHGKHFDLTTHGPLHGLLMGLAQLNCSELRLKRISHRHGLLGIEKLMTFLVKEWLNDIKKNQIPSLLVGVGPLHSFVQLFQGIRDLFCLPFEQYKKDGRFFRGLHRGANSFTTSTAMAALELTTRLIHLIQITAETAFDMLTPGPSVRINPKTKGSRKRYGPPKDIREGVTNALILVKEGIEETADNILQVASHEREQKGYSGAVGGVIRQIPPTMIKPIIIVSEATNNVLGGMRCQLVPDVRKEANQKWRRDAAGTFDSNL